MSKVENSTDYKQLARDTAQWARDNGCVRDSDKLLPNTFTKSENLTDKPVWAEQFPELADDAFPNMWYAGSTIGIYICYQTATGWYIGTAEEFGQTLATMIKSLDTRQDTMLRHTCNALLCDQPDEVLTGFASKNKQYSISRWITSQREQRLSLGVPHQEHLVSLFMALEAGDKL